MKQTKESTLSHCRLELQRARAEYGQRPNPKTRRRIAQTSQALVDALEDANRLGEALTLQQQELDRLNTHLQRTGAEESRMLLAQAHQNMAELYSAVDRTELARSHYADATQLYGAESAEEGTPNPAALGQAQIRLGVYTLADPSQLDHARDLMLQGLETCKLALKSQNSEENGLNLAEGLEVVSDLYGTCYQDSTKKDAYRREATALLRSLHETFHTARSCNALAELLFDSGPSGVTQAIKLWNDFAEQNGSIEARANLARGLETAAHFYLPTDVKQSQKYFSQAQRLWQILEHETGDLKFRRYLAQALMEMGEALLSGDIPSEGLTPDPFRMANQDYERAYAMLETMLDAGEQEVHREFGSCAAALGDIYRRKPNFSLSRRFYEKALSVFHDLDDPWFETADRKQEADLLHRLGQLSLTEDDPDRAIRIFGEEETFLEHLLEKSSTPEIRADLKRCYESLSELYRESGEIWKAQNYILKKAQIGSSE